MKLTTCCLLAILTGTAALAQTHPKKKLVRKRTVVRRTITESLTVQTREEFICVEPLLPPTSDIAEVAPAEVPDSVKVYTYVEQMPRLNNQSGFSAIITAINQRLVVPLSAPDGRIFVRFEINKKGVVQHPEIVKGLRADVDSAVVAATRQLPRFTPGRHGSGVVTVSFTLPITIPVAKQP